MAEPPLPRRRPFWKIAAAVLLSLPLLWAAAALTVRLVASARWSGMKTQWQALLDEARARDRSRPPLRGEAASGNAWDDYALATREVRTLYDLEARAARNYLESGSGPERALVEKVLVRHRTMIDAVRRGAARADASHRLDWKEGGIVLPSGYGTAVISRLAVCQARFLTEQGFKDATDLLVDACRFAGDLDHVEDMEPCFRELNALLEARRLGVADLEALARELEVLDRSFPRRGQRVLLDFVTLGSHFIRSGGSITPQIVGIGADPEESLWRFWFSPRLMKTDAFDILGRAVRQLIEADDRPWPESRDLLQRLAAELAASPNPIARTAPEELLRSDLPYRGHRAQLRLIRAALHFKATGGVPDLEDPFGGRLLHKMADGALKIWSVGPEGRDHGGVGTFSFGADGQDILLEVRR